MPKDRYLAFAHFLGDLNMILHAFDYEPTSRYWSNSQLEWWVGSLDLNFLVEIPSRSFRFREKALLYIIYIHVYNIYVTVSHVDGLRIKMVSPPVWLTTQNNHTTTHPQVQKGEIPYDLEQCITHIYIWGSKMTSILGQINMFCVG